MGNIYTTLKVSWHRNWKITHSHENGWFAWRRHFITKTRMLFFSLLPRERATLNDLTKHTGLGSKITTSCKWPINSKTWFEVNVSFAWTFRFAVTVIFQGIFLFLQESSFRKQNVLATEDKIHCFSDVSSCNCQRCSYCECLNLKPTHMSRNDQQLQPLSQTMDSLYLVRVRAPTEEIRANSCPRRSEI